MRRFVGATLITAGVASGLVALAEPAAARESDTTVSSSSWAYTDSVSPFKSFVGGEGDAPVGAWRDAIGKHHMSKSYFTFNLAAVRGARIFRAVAFIGEKSANDCSKPRATELWRTDVAERPTWQYPPHEHAKQPITWSEPVCVSGRVEWAATDAVQQALVTDKAMATLALRMPRDNQGDVAYGRRYTNRMWITIYYNFPPNVPTNLMVDGVRRCSDGPFFSWNSWPTVSATVSDPDGTHGLAGRLAFWPVDHPEQRVERVSETPFGFVGGLFPEGMITDGNTYAWAARTEDGHEVSAWSEPCLFTADLTRPGAPTVTSPDYPDDGTWHGGSGVPGTFTFGANGVSDVVGYNWAAGNETGFAPADGLGGGATITYTPRRSGPDDISVWSVDRAGNSSLDAAGYHFYVAATEPIVSQTDLTPGYGIPTELRVRPGMPDVVSYTYSMNGGPESTVAADPSGTTMISVIPPNRGSDNLLEIWSTTSTGMRSGINYFRIVTIDGPRVHSDDYPEWESGGGVGVPGQFMFRPRQPGVVEYRYYINEDFDNRVTVPAGPDGTATVVFTPTEPGFHVMTVRSRSAENGWSVSTTDYYFDVKP